MTLSARVGRVVLAVSAIAMLAGGASAQGIGSVATLEGTVEVGREGVWKPLAPGDPIMKGDTIRTGRPGRLRVVFGDNSVLKLSEGSEIIITEQVYDPAGGKGTSILNLMRGKVRSIVSEHYKEPNARFEVHTETAVSGVRGTDFVVAYDEDRRETDVLGVTGVVSVASAVRPNREPVVVRSRELTRVGRDGIAAPVQPASNALFRQFIEDLDFVGGGAAESVSAQYAAGSNVAPPERAGAVAGAAVPSGGQSVVRVFADEGGTYPPDASGLINQPPGSVGLGEVEIPF